jgi:hypothetical protein
MGRAARAGLVARTSERGGARRHGWWHRRFIAATTFGLLTGVVAAVEPASVDAASAPVARRDVIRTDLDTPVSVFPLGNDFDPDGDSVFLVSVNDPAHGEAANNQNGTFTYPPTPGSRAPTP